MISEGKRQANLAPGERSFPCANEPRMAPRLVAFGASGENNHRGLREDADRVICAEHFR